MTSQYNMPESRDRADYGFARVRDIAFDAVQELWRVRQAEGVKQTELAEIIDRDPAWVNRALRGPGNWTLRTFGELVEGLDGEVEIIVHDLKAPPQAASNYDAYSDFEESINRSHLSFNSNSMVPKREGYPSQAGGPNPISDLIYGRG